MTATVSMTLKRAALYLLGGFPRLRCVIKGVTKSDPSLVSVAAADTEVNAAIDRARAASDILGSLCCLAAVRDRPLAQGAL